MVALARNPRKQRKTETEDYHKFKASLGERVKSCLKIPKSKPGVVLHNYKPSIWEVYTYNPSISEVEAGGSP